MIRRIYHFLFIDYPRYTTGIFGILLIAYIFCLPRPLFDSPLSSILEDKNGELLGAKIATDGQWRFPSPDSIPYKFTSCLLTFEDKRFYKHWGVDFISLGRAMTQNISNGRIVSGGSTISMQVMRLSAQNPARTIWQKLIEVIQATRLEWSYSKEEILQLYATHAPFGGNVVGLEAASWRYFGKQPHLLSWGEAAMLAVLPNRPGLIHPGRNRQALLDKRNRLIDRLVTQQYIDTITAELAKSEPLPERPLPLPQLAPHLLARAQQEQAGNSTRIKSTIDIHLQELLNSVISKQHFHLKGNNINNLAAMIVDIETQSVIAYTGNIPNAPDLKGNAVDIIRAPRSTGSILKPFLYAYMLNEGEILPQSIIPDVPSTIHGYQPKNFYEKYDGIVAADKVISRSLNIPMVKMLEQHNHKKFHYQLQQLGLSTLVYPPDHYGLTLILGGAEANLWDLTSAYASMAATLNNYISLQSKYNTHDFDQVHYRQNTNTPLQLTDEPSHLSAAAIWFTFEAMQNLERPNSEGDWKRFGTNKKIAWKTGTSFGFRDAWAIGVTPKYAIGVWAGNADGKGQPELIGVKAAAPVLFDIFNQLPPHHQWFTPPYDDMEQIVVCSQSGFLPLPHCPTDTIWAPLTGHKVAPCAFHKIIHWDGQYRVNSHCMPADQIQQKSWFSLPPLEEYYYARHHPAYQPLPPLREDCQQIDANHSPMEMIYPRDLRKIIIPKDLTGELSKTVFKIAHRYPEKRIYWHIDNHYMGETSHFHSKEFRPTPGEHTLTLVDEDGFRLEQQFFIIGREN